MILYHATNGDAVPDILREGLLPYATSDDVPAVNLSERDMSEFIYHLFELAPDGLYEFEHGHHDVAVLFEVDVTGLELDWGVGCDGEDHHLYRGTIPPERLTFARVYRGENE